MKIRALRLHNVRRFAGRGVAIENIGEGINVLCAHNEFGKSTSFEALHALFFQAHSSMSNDVKALKPYAGGSPRIEADIETPKGRWRITKQYLGSRSAQVLELGTGRLLAQADEAENFIAELVRGGTAGPAGLLWVRQGITGIEARSRSEEDREKQIRAGLLESVQGEVEAVTGGRRMAEIMARTRLALDELVTPTGRPKAGGRYDAAIRARDALRATEARLEGDVRTLRADLDRRADAARRLAEIDREDDRREAKAAIEAAQARLESARSQAERLRAAEAELRLAEGRVQATARELEAFRTALGSARRLHDETGAAERVREASAARRAEATDAVDAARRDEAAAERDEGEARDLLAHLDKALRAREAAERLGEIERQLTAAEAAQRTLEDREARLAHLAVPAKAVNELRDLEVEIAGIEAAVEAARPSVTVAYREGAPHVTIDGTALESGVRRSFEGRAEINVPGVGTITLRADRSGAGTERLTKAQARRATLLGSLKVPSLAAARDRQARADETAREIEALRARLSVLAPSGLARLRESVAAHRPTEDAPLELKGDPVAVAEVLRAAEARRRAARERAQAAAPLRQRADDALADARAAIARFESDALHVAAILGPEAERAARETRLADALALAEREAGAARDLAVSLRTGGPDLASVEATLKRLRSVADVGARETQSLRETLAALNAQIGARADEAVEELWRESRDALDAADARVAAFEREVAVLSALARALEEARLQARDLYLKPVMAELKPLLALLFEDASIVFDDRTLLPQRISRGGVEEEVERLSGGMREQISILTRLAFARLLSRDGRPAPVILDDALVYSDDDRIERMFDALHRQSDDQQIIVFSCRQRAFQRLGGNVLQLTDWQP